MPTFESLKAENPDYCYSCGNWHYHRGGVHNCYLNPVISSLTAAKLEDEATIAELRDDLEREQAALHLKETYRKGVESQLAAARVMIQDKDARIAELERDNRRYKGSHRAGNDLLEEFQHKLSAEQAAHAATREELRKADKALHMAIHKPWLWGSDQEAVYASAIARQAQRAAESKETK